MNTRKVVTGLWLSILGFYRSVVSLYRRVLHGICQTVLFCAQVWVWWQGVRLLWQLEKKRVIFWLETTYPAIAIGFTAYCFFTAITPMANDIRRYWPESPVAPALYWGTLAFFVFCDFMVATGFWLQPLACCVFGCKDE
jgi:hypothetical protein